MYLEKRVVSFSPLPREVDAIEGSARAFATSFRLASYAIAEEGRRILLVSDRVTKADEDAGEMLGGDEATTFENVLQHAFKNAQANVKEVTVFNWNFGHVAYSGKNNKQDQAVKRKTNQAFFDRFKRFVKRYKPDAIVVSGIDVFEYIIAQLTGDFDTQHKITFNRLNRYKIGEDSYPILGTLDFMRMCSYDPKYTKEFPFMLGFFSRGLETAMRGKNRYTIKIDREAVKFNFVNTIKKFDAFYKRLITKNVVSIDTETDNLNAIKNVCYTAQFAWSRQSAYLVPIDHPLTPFSPSEIRYIKDKLRDYFERGRSKYHVYANAKFDIKQLFQQFGVRFYAHRVYDVQAGEYALDENRKLLKNYGFRKPYGPYSLGLISENYGTDIYRTIDFSKGDRGNMAQSKLDDKFIEYGCYDVIVPLWIVRFQRREAKRTGNTKFMTFVTEQLSDTSLAFAQMEWTGAPIHRKHLWNLRSSDGPIEAAIAKARNEFRASPAAQRVNTYLMKKRGIPQGAALWGNSTWLFNPDKPAHMQLLFFKALKLEPLKELKNGDGQIDKNFQAKYKDIPEVKLYTTYKKNKTIRDTFIYGITNKMDKNADCRHDGCIRASYDYTDVVTGRSSSRDPNLQNIPAHGDLAKPIKHLFIAAPGLMIVKNDYSAHEVRDWANESKDEAIAAAFLKGLQYRQNLRIAAFSHEDSAEEWTKIKKEVGWYDLDKKRDGDGNIIYLDAAKKKAATVDGKLTYERKKKVVKRLHNRGDVQMIATIELDIEVFGDVHKLNCQRFFKVEVLEVTDSQRQGVKAVVFGVIYGKGAASLGESLGQTEEYAQNIIDTMFREFKRGGQWIQGIHEFGQRHLYVASPLGMHRHLWGYLHTRKGVVNAMNRRGPNSIIQGMASNIGVASIRIMQTLGWHFFVKHGIPYHWKSTTNYVHDSVEAQTRIHTVPLYLYLIEHASTTLIHRRFREVFGYELTVGLELEFQIGAALSRVKKWDFMKDSLFGMLEKEIEFCQTELGYKINKDAELKAANTNWKIVSDLRRQELEVAVQSSKPAENMLMNSKNARKLGLVILGPDGLPARRAA